MKNINIKEILELIVKIGLSTVCVIAGIIVMALYDKLGIHYPTNLIIGAMCFSIGIIFAILDLVKFKLEKQIKLDNKKKHETYEKRIAQLEEKISSLEIKNE